MYQALYRKWRPKTFSDVVGQEHVTETLQRQVAEGRLSHAYLFTGTRGTGKTTCAKILAKAVNCEHPENGNPCNKCQSCLGIESGGFLDVMELDAASNNGVDHVRALRDEAIYSPAQVKKRVYIIDEVHMLSIAAFNAVTRVDDFAFTPEQSIATAITTYIAQNRGARQPERIRRGFAVGLRLELGYWLLVGCVTLTLRRPILSLFVAGEGADEVIALGSRYLGYMALLYALPALTNSLQGFYRGMGKMATTLIGTCLQAGLRAAAAAVLAPRVGLTGIAFACAFGWCVMLAFEVPYYFWTCKKQNLKKASPMGEKLPQKAADEGRTCRKSPFTGRQRHSRPSSGFASLSHLLPFWRYAPPPPYRGSLSLRGRLLRSLLCQTTTPTPSARR